MNIFLLLMAACDISLGHRIDERFERHAAGTTLTRVAAARL
jgi:hypothetical protein